MKGQWGKLVGWFVATLIASAVVTLGLPLLGGGSWLPDLISAEGKDIDLLFWGLLILSLVIFALVGALVIYCITHFIAKPGDLGDGDHIHGNARMELIWVIVPTIIVTVISVLSWKVLDQNEVGLFNPDKADAKGAATMQVNVRGFQFGWNFKYFTKSGKPMMPDDAEPATELVIPVHQVLRFNVMSCSGKEALGRVAEQKTRELAADGDEDEFAEIDKGLCEKKWDATTAEDREQAEQDAETLFDARRKHREGKKLSKDEKALLAAEPAFKGDIQYADVNHAFWVPEARLKVDAVAGLRTYVQWEATRETGRDEAYEVVCAELCGSGHNGMRTEMCVVSQKTFDWWVGLSTDDRNKATCVNLRLLRCDGISSTSTSELADAMDALGKVTTDKPDASCKDAKEALA
jgi:heme/copper-type cytochrome/quinol oxidase subunit 2